MIRIAEPGCSSWNGVDSEEVSQPSRPVKLADLMMAFKNAMVDLNCKFGVTPLALVDYISRKLGTSQSIESRLPKIIKLATDMGMITKTPNKNYVLSNKKVDLCGQCGGMKQLANRRARAVSHRASNIRNRCGSAGGSRPPNKNDPDCGEGSGRGSGSTKKENPRKRGQSTRKSTKKSAKKSGRGRRKPPAKKPKNSCRGCRKPPAKQPNKC